MALSNLIDDALFAEFEKFGPSGPPGLTPGKVLQNFLVNIVSDDALRREVYDESKFNVTADGFSIADVHAVLDGLIKVLQDPAPDPETPSE